VTAIDLAGKLITLEGLDFSGKSTLIRRLEALLQEQGLDVLVTREPGGTPVGERVRGLLLSPVHAEMLPFSELLLFMVSRAQHTHEVILPALRSGKTVVTSRYRLSSMAYQGYGRGIELDLVRSLNEAATQGREADLTFLIDLPVGEALSRKRGKGDRIEQEDHDFYGRVRNGYLTLAAADSRVLVIDGTGSVDDVFARLVDRLDRSF
jgi:dTMP kinase